DLMPEIRKFFRVEFVNRIDEIIAFQPLALDDLVKVATLRFGDLTKRLRERGITAELTPKAARAVAELSHDPQFGARPINRFIQRRLENPLSRALVAGALRAGTHLVIDFRDGDFLFNGTFAEELAKDPAVDAGPGAGAAGDGSGSDGGSRPTDEEPLDAEDADFEEV